MGHVNSMIKDKLPETQRLARDITNRVSAASKGKPHARKAMLNVLSPMERWISKKSASQQGFQGRIGISPLFSKQQLQSSASKFVSVSQEAPQHYGKQLYTVYLSVNEDRSRFRTLIFDDSMTQHNTFQALGETWAKATLKEFLDYVSLISRAPVKYGAID